MSDLPILVERVMGILMILIGASHITQARIWASFVLRREELQESPVLLVIGLIAAAFGAFVVIVHPWAANLGAALTTIMGWVILMKGAGYLVSPQWMLSRVPAKGRALFCVIRGGGIVSIGIGVLISIWAWS